MSLSPKTWFILPLLLLFTACSSDAVDPTADPSELIHITLRPDIRYQTVRNFGASDAWSCQFVGAHWPIDKREVIARLLFSQEVDPDGSPRGIGLSSWRFNIGAGSAAQGDASDIDDEWRRADGFLLPDGTYDPSRQAGQRWFLRRARDYEVETFTGFVNSPPVALTKNGKAYSGGGNSVNLPREAFERFADFLVRVIRTLQEEDRITLDYLSPVNEPQWDWDQSNQEGAPWRNEEIAAIVRLLDRELRDQSVSTHIEIPETAQIDYLYRTHNRPERSDQIQTFFDPTSPHYLGDLEQVASKVAGHSYFTTWGISELIGKRQALADRLQAFPQLEYWMSEYTLLEDNEEVRGNGRDLGIDPALYLARVIHADLTIAQAAAWQWWLAVSPYDYKDGLVYIDRNENDGRIYPSKMLWALGNYSRFVRPGMMRIEAERSDRSPLAAQFEGLMISAFSDPRNGKTVTVALNYSTNARKIQISQSGRPVTGSIYRTSATEDLQLIGTNNAADTLLLPARSITTVVE